MLDLYPCRVPACTNLSRFMSRLCDTHQRRYLKTGHTEGRALNARELKPYREHAARIMKAFAHREDLKAGCEWLLRLLTTNPDPRTRAQFMRLRAGGVTGEEMMEALLAVWVVHKYWAARLPDDARLTFQLARSIIRLRKLPQVFARSSLKKHKQYVPRIAFATIGRIIRESPLPVLLDRLVRLDEDARARNAQLLRLIREGDDPAESARLLRPDIQ